MFGIVILNYLNYEDTIDLIKSISKQEWADKVNVYIVDNASPNSSVEYIEAAINEEKFTVDVISQDSNCGFARGENVGIRQARNDGCDFVISINSDVTIDKLDRNFLNKIESVFYDDESIAIITPQIYDSDGLNQNPMEIFPPSLTKKILWKLFFLTRLDYVYYFVRMYLMFTIVSKYVESRNRRTLIRRSKETQVVSRYIYAAHGSCIVLTPTYFGLYCGHDEQVFMYCEEYIKAEQLKNNNLKTWYEDTLTVSHKTSKSVEMMVNSNKEKIRFILKNMIKSCRIYINMLKLFK